MKENAVMPNMSETEQEVRVRISYHVAGNGMHIHIGEWRERRPNPKWKPNYVYRDSGQPLVEVESPWIAVTHHPVTLIVAYSPELHRVYYDPAKQTYFAVADWMEAPDSDCILLGKVGPP